MTDLLLPKKGKFRRLIIKHDQKLNIVRVEGATLVQVDFTDAKKFKKVYDQGLDNRAMRSTDVNETSSRSHLIFSIFIERIDRRSGDYKIGKIIFVDLAGSESLSEIGVDPRRYKEGMQINESIICLGRAIREVALNATKTTFNLHLLTELMQDSFGGDSKTLMIACISPSEYDIA